MNGENGKVAEKIKKLFSLAGNNPSQEEAEAAMLKAQELLLSNGLVMSDIEIAETEKKEVVVIQEHLGNDKVTAPIWKKRIVSVIAKNFRVTAFITSVDYHYTNFTCRGHRDWLLVGEKNDVHVAKLTINFMFNAFERFWKEYKILHTFNIRRLTEIMKDSYSQGFTLGIATKFKEQIKSKELIVVQDKAVGEYIKTNIKSHKEHYNAKTQIHAGAMNQGYQDGKSLEKDKFLD